MTSRVRFKLLTDDSVRIMYQKCVEFLSNKGIKIIDHPQGLKMLDKAGAQVDFDSGQVRFSKDMIEEALRTVPTALKLSHDLVLPHPEGLFYVRSVSGVLEILDSDSNEYRDTTLNDVAEWAQLVEVLPEIDIPLYLSPRDVPEETADIHGLKTLFGNTTKHIFVQPFSLNSVEYLFQLALVAAGGAEALKKKPIISIWPTPLSPFGLKDMDMEVVIQAARYGVPILAAPLPGTGGTSPATIAGTVLQSGIEILGLIVMSQLLTPGTPVIGLPTFFTIDMLAGRDLCANVESALGSAATAQFIKDAFHIPTATWAFGSDSYLPDGQSGIEKTLGGLLASGVGCDILCGAGFLDVGKTCSPVQLIIDNDMISIIKRAIAGVKVDEDTLAWQEILNTAPGGHYLEQEHTLRHCRDALRTELFASQSRDTWKEEGSKDLYARALHRYREIKKKLKPLELPAEVQKELDQIVKQADGYLVK
ncbi:trimethylamine methyltransferase family protein [Chloroflexota bacterium]